MKQQLIKWFLWLTVFSIAMGFLETAVVVYLRELYYPNGFAFPLVPIPSNIAVVEFWREVATLVMLLGAGVIAGRSAAQRFAGFLFCFAVWDIFYYVFLKVLCDWPSGMETWDVLFLVPFPWVGPVATPLLITAVMIVLSSGMSYFDSIGLRARIHWLEWIGFVLGSLIVILSWVWDYMQFVSRQFPDELPWTLSLKRNLFSGAEEYVPVEFNWWVFGIGFFLICLSLGQYYFRMLSTLRTQRSSSF